MAQIIRHFFKEIAHLVSSLVPVFSPRLKSLLLVLTTFGVCAATARALPPQVAQHPRETLLQLELPASAGLQPDTPLPASVTSRSDTGLTAVFQVSPAQKAKPLALRVARDVSSGTDKAKASPNTSGPLVSPSVPSLRVNDAPLSAHAVRGADGWYFLIPPRATREGPNTVAVVWPDSSPRRPTESLELVTLEETYEIVHFARVFGQPVARIQPPADPSQAKYDALHYDLSLQLASNATIPAATLVLTARSLVDNLQTIALDLDDNDGQMTVTGVDTGVESKPLAYTLDGAADRLFVTLTAPVPQSSTFTLCVRYQGTPNPNSTFGAAFGAETHGTGTPIVFTLSEPYGARTWWPCKDLPDDKATQTTRITCAKAYTAVSNGTLVSNTDNGNGTRTFVWNEIYPISTYLVSVTCTNFQMAESAYTALDGVTTMPVRHYVYPEYYSYDGPSALPGTVRVLEVFSQLFGEYPFLAEKYSNVSFPWGGGMEHQTCTSMYPQGLGPNGLGLTNVHETAHQWFGDLITMKHFDHLWLNEGFATYCEALFQEHESGTAAYHSLVNNWWVYDSPPLVSNHADDFNGGIVYNKGGWVLHMLRHVVGDAAFFQAIRNYVQDPALAYGNAMSDDFKAHVEAASGQNLDGFFTPWLSLPGRPTYRYAWRAAQEDGHSFLYLWTDQVQTQGLYSMPVDLLVQNAAAASSSLEKIQVEGRNQTFKLPLGDLIPSSVKWDPDNWILDNVTQVAFPAQALWTSSDRLDFGSVNVGENRPLSLELENLGTTSTQVTSLTIEGDSDGAFSLVTSPALPLTLNPAPGNPTTLTVRFTPPAVGEYAQAALAIKTPDRTLSIPLSGSGKTHHIPSTIFVH